MSWSSCHGDYTPVSCIMWRGVLDAGLVTLAHEGTKAYRLAFDLLHRREATGPNELWQADHTPLDVWVRDERGTPIHPWLTVILDDYSRAVAAYRLGLTVPTTLTTALALRDAIGRKVDPRWQVCGIPQTFSTDNGGDFTSRHLEQVALELKMQLVCSEPGMPRGRGRIERFFNTINQLFLCTLPGYAPTGAPPPGNCYGCVRTRTRVGRHGRVLVAWRRWLSREGVACALSSLRRVRDHRAGAAHRARLAHLPLPRLRAGVQRADRHAVQPVGCPYTARRAKAAP